MPHPHSRRLTPEDLARQLARQIASKKPPKPNHRLRDSVLVGRLITAVMGLAMVAAVLAVVLVGTNWWNQRSPAAEVLSSEVTLPDEDVSSDPIPATDPSGIQRLPQRADFRLTEALLTALPSPLALLPDPATTIPGAVPGSSSTGQQGTSSSSDTPPTVAPTTAPAASPTTSATTTSTPQQSTTQPPTTTTLQGTSTSTATSTTCAGNSGSGNGKNCG